jgi:hypothetical protein
MRMQERKKEGNQVGAQKSGICLGIRIEFCLLLHLPIGPVAV